LASAAREQRAALETMLPLLDGRADQFRATVLRRMARWCTAPVVAFTQFAATARALHRLLRHATGIALLTGQQARIASGVIGRTEVLDRLLARARDPHRAVRLLITTDVLSEGLSLAGVATIVHLDLPWTAARLDQRVGRAARIGAPVRTIHVVSLPAPVPGTVRDALVALLARKRRAMRRFSETTDDDVAVISALRSLVGDADPVRTSHTSGWSVLQSPLVSDAVTIALVGLHGRRTLVASDAHGPRRIALRDWLALAAATPAPRQHGWIRRLRRALVAHLADAALTRRVHDAADARLRHRRQADESLALGDRASRSQLSHRVTNARRTVMHLTTPAAVARLAAEIGGMHDDTTPDRAELREVIEAPWQRPSVRILYGVVLLPVPAGP
ncbi:MAG TPA: C-terminal helicase domain-containing protein, partial [Gemmatimonadaceae bacterium]|nr:C-terminal helicase domain-containing protein [Gemmatimonadaceae bacterium]